jgi:hypothetical protein
MTNHLFSFESFFLLPDRLCVLKRSKSLRNSVLATLIITLCASALPSTTCIIKLCWCRSYCTHYSLMCFGTTTCHGVVIGHALHPVTLAIRYPTAHVIMHFILCASVLSVTVYSSGKPCTP